MDTNSIITAVIHSVHLLPVHTRVYFIIKDILHWNLWTFIFIVFIFVTITIYQLFIYLFIQAVNKVVTILKIQILSQIIHYILYYSDIIILSF